MKELVLSKKALDSDAIRGAEHSLPASVLVCILGPRRNNSKRQGYFAGVFLVAQSNQTLEITPLPFGIISPGTKYEDLEDEVRLERTGGWIAGSLMVGSCSCGRERDFGPNESFNWTGMRRSIR